MNGKTKSILLQVAFYGAAGQSGGVVDEATVASNFETLLALHERFGINPDEGRGSGGGSTKPNGEVFTYNNILVEDFRATKKIQNLKPNFPDFKTVNGDVIEGITNPRGAAWLTDQEGNPNEDITPLVAAANEKVF